MSAPFVVTRPPMTVAPPATVGGLNAKAAGMAGYQIEVVFPDASLTASQKAAFTTAANRWMSIITGDLPDGNVSGQPIDDVRITAAAPAIDGAGGVLGSAGPEVLRGSSLLPLTGSM